MTAKLLELAFKNRNRIHIPFGAAGGHCSGKYAAGNREVVGYGFNGNPTYQDRFDFPMPALRWKETNPDIACLRELEKGDWNKLSLKEKKCLYRASFCQTFAEMDAPDGKWKSCAGAVLMIVTSGFWLFFLMKLVYNRAPLPDSFCEESQRAQLRRMIDIESEPITGIASKWDYDKCCWKK